ncbi:matrix-remodeling-associated protein 5-like isoform X2 [Cyprinodon tularosa]|uniref:matrix-remodeling-associated protein 5-like isoform X2 n=1 Tax=Cyprinodon tularosa TaxID=77115 RepID=UPI0018E28F7B|nr:matrix-remodeling-associated protein 5-like isoform X2 [Cyprinodon tularosa]
MYQIGSAPIALLALLVLTLKVPRGESCPRSCNCYQANEVHCTFRSLLTVPPSLPERTRRINLGFNSIGRLDDKSLLGLKRVELLMLHSNDLQHLPDGVFKDMKSLQILKLSYNKLTEISSSLTFSGLTSLLRLYLDHNLLQHIHPRALLQLPSLRLLRLQGNRLHQLHPHALCTLSILNTYYFSTLRHIDLSNNSLTILPKGCITTAPLLETLNLHANPWSCDCRMKWLLSWSLAHPGLLKCPGGPGCPVCAFPLLLQGQGLLDQTTLQCSAPIINFPGKKRQLESDLSKINTSENFREPFGNVSLGLSDQQGYSVDLNCNITHTADSPDIAPPPDLSWSSSSPLSLALSLPLDCPVVEQTYQKLWRILAYYSETAVRLEKEIMLSKAPALAYRYKQTLQTDGYYHTGIKASVQAIPEWLLQSAISIQLDRAKSNMHTFRLIYSTRVSAQPDTPFKPTLSSPSYPWVMILTNHTNTVLTAVAGRDIQLSCPFLSSTNPSVQWILPDGSKLNTPFSSLDGRLQVSASSLLLKSVQLSDGGLYYCVAKAGRDVDVLPLHLAVEESSVSYSGELSGPPVFGTIGDTITLTCRISGSPEPLASWILPDGNIARQGLAVSGGSVVHLNGSLSLLRPTLKDRGYYRCIAVNQHGRDTMSMELILKAQQISGLETTFPRGPQSASGRSTKIPAPIFGQIDEGSGDEEDEGKQKTSTGILRYPTSLQQHLNKKYPIKKQQRIAPVREGPMRRVGGPTSSNKQISPRFKNRHRLTTKKHRIDPQKWADLLAKIRQKTANSTNTQITSGIKPTTESIYEGKDKQLSGKGKAEDTNRVIAHTIQEEPETEGSSVDDTNVKGEKLQPIQPPNKDAQIIKTRKNITKTENLAERPEDEHLDSEIGTKTHTENENKQTVKSVSPVMEIEHVTLNTSSETNDIVLGSTVLHEQGPKLSPVRTGSQNPQKGLFPNMIPNSRPRSPWNTRRKIGQRRRNNRPRIQPVNTLQPYSDPLNVTTHAVTLKSTPDTITVALPVSTPTFPPIMVTLRDYFRTAPNVVTQTPLSSTISDSQINTTSDFVSLPLKHSPATQHTYTDTGLMIHSGKEQITEESAFNSTLAPTHSTIIVSEAYVPGTDNRTFTHAVQAYTTTQTTLGKHAEITPSKLNKELETNVLGESYFSVTHSLTSSLVPTASSTTANTAKIITTSSAAPKKASYFGSTKSPPASMTNEDAPPTTTQAVITSPTMSPSTPIITPVSRQTSAASTSTFPTFSSKTSSTLTSNTPYRPVTQRLKSYSNPPNSKSNAPVSINAILNSLSHSFSTTASGMKTTILTPTESALTSTHLTKVTTRSTLLSTTTTMETRDAKALPRSKEATGPFDHRVNNEKQRQMTTDWKNHGVNTIPDLQRNRFHQPPSSLPASPRAPVVNSKPRIADPHIRRVSVPAGSMARLTCEVQGVPKPSITWTKVPKVMSIHSRAQRFEVLPNGTLVIQNVQVQDKGTYICSATSYLGRDRLLTILEVWTRPPHMQLMTYREVTIHQGGQVHLKCQADGAPSPLLSWVLPNGSTLTSISTFPNRFRMDTNGTLYISVALPADQGVYRCVASNSAGATSATVRLYVSSLPPVIQQPREEHLRFAVGWPVFVHCSARGSPTPTLLWQIPDGKLVRPSQFLHGNLFVLPNGTLHIRNLGLKDTGSYECTATNAIGTSKRTVMLDVQDEEENSQNTSNSSLFNKSRTSLIPSQPSDTFSSTKFSLLNISDRTKNLTVGPSPISFPTINKKVKDYQQNFTNIRSKNNFSVFSPSTLLTNNTKVSPSVNSTRVTSSSTAEKKPLAFWQTQPVSPFTKARIVSTSPFTSTVNYGGSLNLNCSVIGYPSPTIIWRIPTRKLVDMHYSFDQRLKVHPNGTLSVHAVTQKDSGDYLCIARNKVADDYRILRVSVATKPPTIEPKQPVNQTVSIGEPLKVDCQASGLPHPAVRWNLPNGTILNSVLIADNNRGQKQQITVFDNGTLLVPAVGIEEEGEYICYAENQAGQDTMKIIVRAMRTTTPNFIIDKKHHYIKVRQGETATIPCLTKGDPAPTVTWLSPELLVIPQSLGSGPYSERFVVASDGTLKVHSAQSIDSGNYTCQTSNSAGINNIVVNLDVELSTDRIMGQVVKGQGIKKPDGYNGVITIRNMQSQSNVIADKIRNNSYSNNSRIRNLFPNSYANSVFSASNPTLRGYGQHGFKSPVQGFTTPQGNVGIRVRTNEAENIGIRIDSTELNRSTASIQSRSGHLDHRESVHRGESAERNPETNNNEVIAEKKSIDTIISRDNSRLPFISTNGQSIRGMLPSNGAGTSTVKGRDFNRNRHLGVSIDSGRNGISSRSNSDRGLSGGRTTKQRAVKGQTVTLPCPYQGHPPQRLAWLRPGNGMLPAPYYGNRLTVHHNGSLELRNVQVSDSGTLICIAKTEGGDTLMRIQLQVFESFVEMSSGQEVENKARKENLNSSQTSNLRTVSSVQHQQSHLGFSDIPHVINSSGTFSSVSKPMVNTRTAPVVSTIDGETLRLLCPASQISGSFTWMMPGGKMLSRGDNVDQGRYVVQEDGTLIIKQVSVYDRGNYICRFSSHDPASVSITTVPVIVIAYPPRISVGPLPVTYTTAGVAVELPCLTIATPRATVSWETPDLTQLTVMGRPRIYGNLYLSPNGSLLIQNPSHRDTGFYRCIAKNVIGVDSKATYLHVM